MYNFTISSLFKETLPLSTLYYSYSGVKGAHFIRSERVRADMTVLSEKRFRLLLLHQLIG